MVVDVADQKRSKCRVSVANFKLILGSPVSKISLLLLTEKIVDMASRNDSEYVCVANVHMLMEAYWSESFRKVLYAAKMVAPDGMPLVWMLKFMGNNDQERVSGMKLFLSVCNAAQKSGLKIALVGSKSEILDRMLLNMEKDFPNLKRPMVKPLPFRPLSEDESSLLVRELNSAGIDIVFVSLGCPKQERFMHEYRGRVNSVMIGIGGVFPVYAGLKKLAPDWMQSLGLEWFFRFLQEPRRLWKRYAATNLPFIILAIKQLLFSKGKRNQ